MDPQKLAFYEKIEGITGKGYNEIKSLYEQAGITKHSELRDYFIESLKLTYGYANTLAHYISGTDGESLAEGKAMSEILDEIYEGKKAHFRSLHELIMTKIEAFGPFEIVPKKGYLSLKRKRQFVMIGPKTATRMELGINLTGLEGTSRLLEQPKGSMCKFIVRLETPEEVDAELLEWLALAYEQSN